MTRFIYKAGLIVGLALSATAGAQPARYDHDRTNQNTWDRDRVHYGRFDQWGGYRMYQNRWTQLGNEFTAQTNRQFIHTNDRTFDRIRIEAVRGRPYVVQVAVIYTAGNTQVIPIKERLDIGAGEVLRTNGEPVRRIVVYTDPAYGGTYSVLGAPREVSRYRY